jgi:hypothetical protein
MNLVFHVIACHRNSYFFETVVSAMWRYVLIFNNTVLWDLLCTYSMVDNYWRFEGFHCFYRQGSILFVATSVATSIPTLIVYCVREATFWNKWIMSWCRVSRLKCLGTNYFDFQYQSDVTFASSSSPDMRVHFPDLFICSQICLNVFE